MAILNQSQIAKMRSEVLATALDHKCTIQRATQTATDPDGNPIVTWADFLVNEPCHYWESSENELVGTENVVITSRRLVLQANRGVKPSDRVTQLIGYDGIEPVNAMDILHVINRVSQAVCMVEEIA